MLSLAFVILLLTFFFYNKFPQVIIGSPDLKANHAIRQHVDIVPENQKYNK